MTPDPWNEFASLTQMTFEIVTPAFWLYWLLAPLPLLAFLKKRYAVALRALAGIVLAHAGALAVLLMGATLYGVGRAHPTLSFVQMGVAAAGIWSAVAITKPLREPLLMAYGFYVLGATVLNLLALFVGGMALYNDWI